ncbi:hypothetical protein Q9295_12805 [Xinfangfangia sp. CPCC 101601]|uniref:Lipoprotein n=1 Tax=Pseudogemmobacter lacusdianii TaxID=3069608 RepID=A0ABU0VZS0_9RHOB|nr:hypothetical protein [Xinfangfangia sp. CPCC 101601]MDQ2067249.1 hypothetical protein [Xinfangfangia sp. CPCC 101601]
MTVALPLVTPWQGTAQAGAPVIAYRCSASQQLAPEAYTPVCTAFLQHLRQRYPQWVFAPQSTNAASPAEPTLTAELHIAAAQRNSTIIQLVWSDAQGQRHPGEVHSVSSMDRSLNASMQSSLYERSIALTPVPIPTK